MGRNKSHKKGGREEVVEEGGGVRKRSVGERGIKGGVKRRVSMRKSEQGGREREKDIELDQRNNYRQ